MDRVIDCNRVPSPPANMMAHSFFMPIGRATKQILTKQRSQKAQKDKKHKQNKKQKNLD
jgi:hypothetical protein